MDKWPSVRRRSRFGGLAGALRSRKWAAPGLSLEVGTEAAPWVETAQQRPPGSGAGLEGRAKLGRSRSGAGTCWDTQVLRTPVVLDKFPPVEPFFYMPTGPDHPTP